MKLNYNMNSFIMVLYTDKFYKKTYWTCFLYLFYRTLRKVFVMPKKIINSSIAKFSTLEKINKSMKKSN